MKVILLSELKGKGGEGDIVEVADGYANNYLFPQKIAVAATTGNLTTLLSVKQRVSKKPKHSKPLSTISPLRLRHA